MHHCILLAHSLYTIVYFYHTNGYSISLDIITIGISISFSLELILHPRTPMYIVGKSFSYKSYMVATKFQEFYPRYNKETPEFYKDLLEEFAESVRLPDEVYNPETFVLEREISYLKDYVAVISEQDLKNPHIRFFNEQNPGWTKVSVSKR